MSVEFIAQKVSRIRWKSPFVSLTDAGHELAFCTGSWDQMDNLVTLWSLQIGADKMEMVKQKSLEVDGDVTQLLFCGEKKVLVTTTKGSVYLFNVTENDLTPVAGIKNLHSTECSGTPWACNDIVYCKNTNRFITCGSDGTLAFLAMRDDSLSPDESKSLVKSCFLCLDVVGSNEIIFGTETGHLQVDDS